MEEQDDLHDNAHQVSNIDELCWIGMHFCNPSHAIQFLSLQPARCPNR